MYFVSIDDGPWPDIPVGPFLRPIDASSWAVRNLPDGDHFTVRRLICPTAGREWRDPGKRREVRS